MPLDDIAMICRANTQSPAKAKVPSNKATTSPSSNNKRKGTTISPQYKQEETVLNKKSTKDVNETAIKETTTQQETSEPNKLELLDKCNKIVSLLISTIEQVKMEYDGNNSILTITDENGATYQYKILTNKDNGKDYLLSPLASTTPGDYTH